MQTKFRKLLYENKISNFQENSKLQLNKNSHSFETYPYRSFLKFSNK